MPRTVGARVRTRPGSADRARAWQAMRVLVRFTGPQIEMAAEIGEANLQRFIRALVRTGYLLIERERVSGRAASHNVYRLVRNSGPKTPILWNSGEVFDENLRRVFCSDAGTSTEAESLLGEFSMTRNDREERKDSRSETKEKTEQRSRPKAIAGGGKKRTPARAQRLPAEAVPLELVAQLLSCIGRKADSAGASTEAPLVGAVNWFMRLDLDRRSRPFVAIMTLLLHELMERDLALSSLMSLNEEVRAALVSGLSNPVLALTDATRSDAQD